jgi:hypothetical protein
VSVWTQKSDGNITPELKILLADSEFMSSNVKAFQKIMYLKSGNQQAVFRCACVFSKMFSKRFRLRRILFFLKKTSVEQHTNKGISKNLFFFKTKSVFCEEDILFFQEKIKSFSSENALKTF